MQRVGSSGGQRPSAKTYCYNNDNNYYYYYYINDNNNNNNLLPTGELYPQFLLILLILQKIFRYYKR